MAAGAGKPDTVPRILAVAVAAALVGFAGAGLIAFQGHHRARQEFDRRVSVLPKAFTVANANAIIREDVATLRTAVRGLFQGPVAAEAGLLYVYIIDPDGNAVTTEFSTEVPNYNRFRIDAALRTGAETAAQAASSQRSARERLGLASAADTSGKPGALSASPFRPVRTFRITPLVEGQISYVDVAVPVIVMNQNWGAIRMGFRDSLTEEAARRWSVIGATIVFVLVGVSFLSIFVGRGITDRFAEHLEGEATALRRKFEKILGEARAAEPSSSQDAPLQAQEFFGLLDAAKDLGSTLIEEEVLDIAVKACVSLLHARDVSVFLVDPNSSLLVGRIGHGEGGILGPEVMSQVTIPIGHGEIGMAAEFGTTAVIDDPRPGSGVVSALIARGQTLGVLLGRNKSTGRPFLKRDRLIARLLAQFTANAMASARVYREAQQVFPNPVENG